MYYVSVPTLFISIILLLLMYVIILEVESTVCVLIRGTWCLVTHRVNIYDFTPSLFSSYFCIYDKIKFNMIPCIIIIFPMPALK